MMRYRFPTSRGRQLARTHARVTSFCGSLSRLVSGCKTAEDIREWLVCNAPGIGPKQASMFLRNIGYSYDLATIDRHVLTYMTSIGIEKLGTNVTGLSGYIRRETAFHDHARDLGLRSGCWIGRSGSLCASRRQQPRSPSYHEHRHTRFRRTRLNLGGKDLS